jgi:hypothetical protein
MPRRFKGLEPPCIICGENRHTENCHFPRRKLHKGDITIILCPTHHKLLDNGRINKREMEKIWINIFPDKASTLEKFVDWAHENGYSYSLEELKERFWDHIVEK